MLRWASGLLLCAATGGLAAGPGEASGGIALEHHLASLAEADTPLATLRAALPECQAGCLTPAEAAAMAFAAGEGERRPGRFLLDVRGGGQSLHGELGTLFFVNSRPDYATLGTLTVAFEPAALRALLQRAKVCGAANVVEGQISVKGCRREGVGELNMFTMMQRLGGRRIVVEGEVRLQWIDSAIGTPRPVANIRGEHERGYYQVWVQVSDADQVIFVYDED